MVISQHFVSSQYCEYELVLARMQSVERSREVFVPVLLELPDVDHVSSCLHWVLRTLTYIQWPHNECERDEFWNTLRVGLRRNI